MSQTGPIGVFDSGYGGLTILKEIVGLLPEYDYLYLGDNARSPYGTRSFDTVYQYTREAVQWLCKENCPLIILACNTASAKALRTLQQKDLPQMTPLQRVLGVIRPTAEIIGEQTDNQSIGILATAGTVSSASYPMEIGKFFPGVKVFQEACPMWVPLVENGEADSPGADYFIRKNLESLFAKGEDIDTVLLGCTHYPLLMHKIKEYLPVGVKLISQGEIVAKSLVSYLERHPEIAAACGQSGRQEFYTTDDCENFKNHSEKFFGQSVKAKNTNLEIS